MVIVLLPKEAPVKLTITDEETCRIASELAEITSETVTDAITTALRKRLEREREIQTRLQKMRAISKRVAKSLRDDPSAVEHGDFLYDERGLPK